MGSSKKIIINIGLSIMLAFIGVFSYSSITSNKVPKELKSLHEKALDINIINSALANLALTNNLNEATMRKDLPIAIDKLSKIKASIDSISITDKFNPVKLELQNGLNTNTLFYKQLLAILNNPKGKDIDESLKNLNKYYIDSCTSYNKCKELDIKFSKVNPNFYSNIESYVYSKSTIHQDDAIVELQNKTFLVSFENMVDKFSQINKDYILSIEKCREKKASYNDVLSELEKNSFNLKELSLDLYSLSIPNEGNNCYEAFLKSLSLYKNFNEELISSLKNEMESKKNSSSNLDKLYSNAKENKANFDSSYIEFEELFKKYKNIFN